MDLVVIDSNEKTSKKKVYNRDMVVHGLRWLEKEGGYRWLDLFGSPKTLFSFNHAFCKPRVYRANRHPGHRNRHRTSTICHICLKWFWDRN